MFLDNNIQNDLSDRVILITAGPTIEDIDPVRFISNRSTGKMGVAIAIAAVRRGAEVILIHGPLKVSSFQHPGIRAIPVRSAADMHAAVTANVSAADTAIMCAAVCDFTPVHYKTGKIKKERLSSISMLELKRTPDILASIAQMKNRPLLIGFAAESENVAENARAKLARKGCDMIYANDISEDGSGFAHDTNRLTLFKSSGETVEYPAQSKRRAAEMIMDEIASVKQLD